MELQPDLEAWSIDRIRVCRTRRRTFQGAANSLSSDARVEIVRTPTVSKENGDLYKIYTRRAWAILSLRRLGANILHILAYKCADLHSAK